MPSNKTPAKTVNKSVFIRNQPTTLSAAEVVAKAKASGIRFTPQLVYNVRGSATKKHTKAAAPATKPNLSSKSEFIRRIPASTPAKDVVAQGKAAGLKFDTDYVYKARKTAKKTLSTATNGAASTKPAKSKADFVRAQLRAQGPESPSFRRGSGTIRSGWLLANHFRTPCCAIASSAKRLKSSSCKSAILCHVSD